MRSQAPFSFDVRVSESLDALLLRCRDCTDPFLAIRALREGLPTAAKIRMSSAGIRVAPEDASLLHSHQASIDVRWTEECERFLINRERVRKAYPKVHGILHEIKQSGGTLARQMISDSGGIHILDQHQIVNVAAMTVADGFGLCLFDEQGAGKTVTLIFAFDLLSARDEVDQMLIVAPKSMLSEWPKDFERFCGGLYHVTSVSGSGREKRAAIQDRSDVYVTNFETIVSMERHFESLLRLRPDRSVLVVDESFFIKSPDAKRTLALRRLREWCGRAFVLCGTPAPNAPQDLVQQFTLVDFGLAFDGAALPRGRKEAMPVVRQIVEDRGLYIRHLKSDVLSDLPSRRFHRLYVHLRPEQRVLYEKLRDRLAEDLRSATNIQFQREYHTFLARRTALLQVCSSPATVAEGHTEIPAKLVLLDDLLDRFIRKNGEKVVLWSFYTATIDAMVGRYARFGTLRYDGSVSGALERGETVRRFQEDDDFRLLVANPAAAGAGLTLHRSRIAVYESMSNQAAHYLQSLDRIHRRGQAREVEYVVLLCEDTLEVMEYERLLRKQRMAENLLGDDVVLPVTREGFLRDLYPDQPSHNRRAQ